MGTLSNFPNRLPAGGNEEFAEALWDSLTNDAKAKFSDPEKVDKFLQEIEDSLNRAGLTARSIAIGIDPEERETVFNITAAFS